MQHDVILLCYYKGNKAIDLQCSCYPFLFLILFPLVSSILCSILSISFLCFNLAFPHFVYLFFDAIKFPSFYLSFFSLICSLFHYLLLFLFPFVPSHFLLLMQVCMSMASWVRVTSSSGILPLARCDRPKASLMWSHTPPAHLVTTQLYFVPACFSWILSQLLMEVLFLYHLHTLFKITVKWGIPATCVRFFVVLSEGTNAPRKILYWTFTFPGSNVVSDFFKQRLPQRFGGALPSDGADQASCSVPAHHRPKIFASSSCSKVVVVLGASQVSLCVLCSVDTTSACIIFWKVCRCNNGSCVQKSLPL